MLLPMYLSTSFSSIQSRPLDGLHDERLAREDVAAVQELAVSAAEQLACRARPKATGRKHLICAN